MQIRLFSASQHLNIHIHCALCRQEQLLTSRNEDWLARQVLINVHKFYSLQLTKLFVYAHKQATQAFSLSTPHKYGIVL